MSLTRLRSQIDAGRSASRGSGESSPTHADMPAFDVGRIAEHDPHLAGGIKGVGMIGTAAAIVNAVFHATGRRLRTLPIGLEQLL